MEHSIDFTEGKILKPLLLFAMPILLALFLQALYGAVDLLVVGQFAASEDVSAVAVGSQIMLTITNLISSFAMGATIYLAQKIGEGDRKKGGAIIGTAVLIFAVIGCVLTILIPLFSGNLANLMNAPAEAFEKTEQYIKICGAGSLMIIAYNLIGSIFRGIGDSRTPLVTVAIASVCNIIGDLILVRGFDMGASGAAVATVAAQTVSVAVSFFIIRRIKLPFEFSRQDIRLEKSILKKIAGFGTPIAIQDFLVGLSFLIIMAIVNALGLVESAGVGVAEKVCGFIMLVPAAFMQAMSAFVAQNTGAGRPERAARGLKIAIAVSTMFGFFMFLSSFFFGNHFAAIFSKEQDVISAAFLYLKAYAVDCLFTCFLFCFIGYYNGIGATKFVMVQGISAAFLIRVPVAYAMSRLTGNLFHIGLGIPCSTVYQIALCFLVWRRLTARYGNANQGEAGRSGS